MNKALLVLPETMETERLFMRSYRQGDGPLFFMAGIRNQVHLGEFEWGNVLLYLRDEEHSERVVQDLSAKWAAGKYFFIGLFEKDTEEWVGQLYAASTRQNLPEFTLGFVADVNFEGKGYISESVTKLLEVLFKEMNAHRVISDCHEKNIRSIRLLESCGFIREGHLRENKMNPDGSFHGDYLYGILKHEYLKKQSKG
jgi:ribosomal-protein-alanine N-acetyltransferase